MVEKKYLYVLICYQVDSLSIKSSIIVNFFYIKQSLSYYFSVYQLVPQRHIEPREARMSDQVCRNVLAKAILQIVCLLTLLFPMAYVYVISGNFKPYHRDLHFFIQIFIISRAN